MAAYMAAYMAALQCWMPIVLIHLRRCRFVMRFMTDMATNRLARRAHPCRARAGTRRRLPPVRRAPLETLLSRSHLISSTATTWYSRSVLSAASALQTGYAIVPLGRDAPVLSSAGVVSRHGRRESWINHGTLHERVRTIKGLLD